MHRFLPFLVVVSCLMPAAPALAGGAGNSPVFKKPICLVAKGDNGCVGYKGGVATFVGYSGTEGGVPRFRPGPYGVFSLRHRRSGDLLVIKPGMPGQSLEEAEQAHVGPGTLALTYPGRVDEATLVTSLIFNVPEIRIDTAYDRLGPSKLAGRVANFSYSLYIPQLPVPGGVG